MQATWYATSEQFHTIQTHLCKVHVLVHLDGCVMTVGGSRNKSPFLHLV